MNLEKSRLLRFRFSFLLLLKRGAFVALILILAENRSPAITRIVINMSSIAPGAVTASSNSAVLSADCPPNGLQTPSELRDQAFKISIALNKPPADQVEKRVGHCFEADGDGNFANREIRPWLNKQFNENPPPKAVKEDGAIASNEDWVAIDIMARTMMAEIGGTKECHKETDYTRALGRLILNRTEKTLSTDPNIKSAFGGIWRPDPGSKYQTNPNIPVLLYTQQFAVWTGSDAANRWAACPSRSSPTWKKILRTAEDAILRPQTFRAATEGMKNQLHYTGGPIEYDNRLCQGYKLVKDATIDGRVIDSKDCMNLWKEPPPGTGPKYPEVKACEQKSALVRKANARGY